MPRVPEAHTEARRRQIIEAAMACFARNGFHQTTMQDICQEAGLSPGAVYRYFSSKEEIIRASCEETLRRNVSIIRSASESEDIGRALESLIDTFFQGLKEPGSLQEARVQVQLWGEALRSAEVRQVLREDVQGHLAVAVEAVTRAQQRGLLDPALDAEMVARASLSLYWGLLLQKALDPSLRVEEYVRVVKALLMGQLRRGGAE